MIATTKPLSEISQDAIDILLREIGAVNTIRFLNQFTGGFGNYTEERERLFEEFTLDEIVMAIEQDRADKTAE